MPLVVVSPGKGSGPRAEINAELQRDMATLSTRGDRSSLVGKGLIKLPRPPSWAGEDLRHASAS